MDDELEMRRGWTVSSGLWRMYSSAQSITDFIEISSLDRDDAKLLLSQLPKFALRQRHNKAPRVEELLTFSATSCLDVRLHGYLVGPSRPDERFCLDGFSVIFKGHISASGPSSNHAGTDAESYWLWLSDTFRLPQGEGIPDEVEVRGNCAWIWWD